MQSCYASTHRPDKPQAKAVTLQEECDSLEMEVWDGNLAGISVKKLKKSGR